MYCYGFDNDKVGITGIRGCIGMIHVAAGAMYGRQSRPARPSLVIASAAKQSIPGAASRIFEKVVVATAHRAEPKMDRFVTLGPLRGPSLAMTGKADSRVSSISPE